MPRRRRQRRTAAHEAPRASTSAFNCASASAAEARPRRCCINPCQLSSRCSLPKDKTSGSLIWTPNCPQARRRRAIGHRDIGLHVCRYSASSRSVWHPHRTHSRLYLSIVVCRSSSGSAQSCSMCVDKACISSTRGWGTGQPPFVSGNTKGAEAYPGVKRHADLCTWSQTLCIWSSSASVHGTRAAE